MSKPNLRIPTALAALVAAALTLPGCRSLDPASTSSLHPDLAASIPGSWSATQGSVSPAAATGWISDINDRRLRALVTQAVDKNYSLAASASRVRQAQSSAVIAGAARFPQLSFDVRGNRSQSIRTTSIPVGDTTPGALADPRTETVVRSTR
ncbi:MAG: TolC family protein, partial [Verrucomicrobiales bacterium]|nr:TolC family protein [Verrucomicrobiales bacterium]